MALQQPDDYYFDPNGLLVFTEKYLLARGFCCGNGCRHCPYGKESGIKPKAGHDTNSKDGAGEKE